MKKGKTRKGRGFIRGERGRIIATIKGTWYIYSEEEIFDSLRQAAGEMGRTPPLEDYDKFAVKNKKPRACGIRNRFGTWAEVCKTAGLPPVIPIRRKRVVESAALTAQEVLSIRKAEAILELPTEPEWGKACSADFLVSEVIRFIHEYGHVPSTNEFRYNKNFPGMKPYKRVWGSFNACLVDIGLKPVSVRKGAMFCCNAIAKDGHVCDSTEEVSVDNWLFENGIEHGLQPLYPRHDELNPKGFIRADFLVDGTYIEYAGLINKTFYREGLNRKIALTTQLGLDLVVVRPTDLSHLETVLGRFLEKRNTLRSNSHRDGIVRPLRK